MKTIVTMFLIIACIVGWFAPQEPATWQLVAACCLLVIVCIPEPEARI